MIIKNHNYGRNVRCTVISYIESGATNLFCVVVRGEETAGVRRGSEYVVAGGESVVWWERNQEILRVDAKPGVTQELAQRSAPTFMVVAIKEFERRQ